MFLKALWTKLKKALSRASSYLALFFIAFYKTFLSGTLGCGGACRFYPSCSEYAFLVYKRQTFLKATFFVLKRLLACHPLGPKIRLEPEISLLETTQTPVCRPTKKAHPQPEPKEKSLSQALA